MAAPARLVVNDEQPQLIRKLIACTQLAAAVSAAQYVADEMNLTTFEAPRDPGTPGRHIGSYTDDSVADAVNNFFAEWRDKFAEPSSSGYDKLYVYQNYANEDEPLSALYGYNEWRHERLTSLKNKFDPRGLFNGYHPVPSNVAGWS
ncbi:hypothetical protein CABS03_13607 [Colletotrichum abscissum]